MEDGSKVASWVRSELEGPDLAKIDCAEAATERMSREGFQDLEKIGIEDPPEGTEDDDDLEWNRGKVQKNQDE